MKENKILTIVVLAVGVIACGGQVCQAGEIAAWGLNSSGQCNVPEPNEGFVAVSAGIAHSLGLKADGSIVAWGNNGDGQCNVPLPNEDFVAVAAGVDHSLGLKSDGSIAAWGLNSSGQCNVPEPNEDFVAVAAYSWHSLGLKSDGSIAAWGENDLGQCNVPLPNADFVAVARGGYHSLGLKADGSIVAWGNNYSGQCNVPLPNEDFVAVSGGDYHNLGLKADGSIVAWERNDEGQCNVPSPNEHFIAVAAGGSHSLGLKGEAESMGTAFTYQGQLYDANSPANGTYDFQFSLYELYDSFFQTGNTLSKDDIEVIDGSFTVELNFGSDVFNGLALRLEVAVRPGQSSEPNDFVTLSPRQEITPAPYAIYAKTAGSDNDWMVVGNNMYSVPSGKVGIGTTNPRASLEIAGNVRIDPNADTTTSIVLDSGATASQWSTFSFLDRGASKFSMGKTPQNDFYIDEPSGRRFTIMGGTGDAIFNGKVGIGTTSPKGKLDVNGSIYQRGTVLHADYVFEPGYELESIEEHSEFMWRHKHLNAIQKRQFDDNGVEIVEVGAHRRGIVEELEKAHIYIEQLHKENKEIKKQLAEMMQILRKPARQQEGVIK